MPLQPHEQRTAGVNYEPYGVVRAGSTDVSSAPMRFSVSALVGSMTVDLIAPMATCGSGCRKTLGMPTAESLDSEVVIVRFAKFGEAALSDGTPLRWLVVMEDGDTLKGPLRVPLEDGLGEQYPGRLELGGRMVMTVQVGDNDPVRLRSRNEPVLAGDVAGWPPYGMALSLTNGPIDYFIEEQLDDPDASPFLSVTSNEVLLGTEPHAILGRAPEIVTASRGEQGVALSWTDTAGEIATTPPITGYHVYRNATPGHVGGWTLAGAVDAATTSWVDADAPDAAVEYLLVHVARCPFGYDLEGLLGAPVLIAART